MFLADCSTNNMTFEVCSVGQLSLQDGQLCTFVGVPSELRKSGVLFFGKEQLHDFLLEPDHLHTILSLEKISFQKLVELGLPFKLFFQSPNSLLLTLDGLCDIIK